MRRQEAAAGRTRIFEILVGYEMPLGAVFRIEAG